MRTEDEFDERWDEKSNEELEDMERRELREGMFFRVGRYYRHKEWKDIFILLVAEIGESRHPSEKYHVWFYTLGECRSWKIFADDIELSEDSSENWVDISELVNKNPRDMTKKIVF